MATASLADAHNGEVTIFGKLQRYQLILHAFIAAVSGSEKNTRAMLFFALELVLRRVSDCELI
ncbi:MAG: hypothetical protein CME31_15320 [Gimesia sp.]|uniref:Uncharacterized protein n=1 Tax=Gimesia maris TaxID=122 RepID=A0A3D3R3I2_9PLAN|nr:hypothetical protein [Gimesia sp.]HCO23431.1 hypothetical protein [Gimesia maris]|tara:strand:+ start:2790 stop:2978 length:189 start_codon:yes stop_codon:yes gene_type:complete